MGSKITQRVQPASLSLSLAFVFCPFVFVSFPFLEWPVTARERFLLPAPPRLPATMTDLQSPLMLHARSPIHLVVPLRPGADLDLVRAQLSGAFAQHDNPVVWHVPRARADIVHLADRAAAAARDSAGLLVAAGGDGTINAVAAAALRAGVPMGVIPMGTFNYFSREQGLEMDAEAAVLQMLQALRAGELRPVQVGFVNGRVFLVNASVGLYPRLLAEREQATRRFGRSRWVAIAAAAWSMLRPSAARRWRVVLRTRQGGQMYEQEHVVTTLFVGNNPLQLEQVGLAQAKAVAQGGQLAVVMLKPQGRWAMARTVWRAAMGQLQQDPAVLSLACAELSVAPAGWRKARVKVAFDGERERMKSPLCFSLNARPLWLVAPSQLERLAEPGAVAQVAAVQPAVASSLVPA
jgi:diacylglycerol kinase family enzyme